MEKLTLLKMSLRLGQIRDLETIHWKLSITMILHFKMTLKLLRAEVTDGIS